MGIQRLKSNVRYVGLDGNEVIKEFATFREATLWVSRATNLGFTVDIKPVINGAIVEIPEDEPPYTGYSRNPLDDIMAEDDDEEVE